MDNGTRITPEVEAFIRAAKGKELQTATDMLKADPKLINAEEAGGFVALDFAAFNGDIQMMEMLIAHKPDLAHTNLDNNTALTMAVKGKQAGAIRCLVSAGADVNQKNSLGATSLHFAAQGGDTDIFDLLMSLGGKIDETPSECGSVLHWACHNDDTKMAGWVMFKHGVAVNVKDIHGGTPLFVALHTKKSEMVKFLLDYGADPKVVIAKDGTSALHIAAEYGTAADVKNLIQFGADATLKNKEGKTALDIATEKKCNDIAKELVKPPMNAAKKDAEAARFKAQGNKVFAEGESNKAARFYSLAISLQPSTHVFFSNRSACNFNTRSYLAGFFDACRCIALEPKFVRGYFRKASCLNMMGEKAEALAVIATGLKIDGKNADLLALQTEVNKK